MQAENELSKAIDDYTIALRIDNRLAEAYYNRGIARAKSGNKQTAILDLSKAGELGLYDAYSVIKRLNKSKIKKIPQIFSAGFFLRFNQVESCALRSAGDCRARGWGKEEGTPAVSLPL